MRKILFILFLLLLNNQIYSQGWLKQAGGTNADGAEGIAVDGSGNSYITGWFEGSAVFGSGETNQTTIISAGNFDLFIAKYDSDGNLVWAKRAGGVSNDYGYDISTDITGNSFIVGNFTNSATFGLGEPNETTLTSAGGNDIYVAKYDSDGNLLWAKRAGGSEADYGYAVAIDGSGNSGITGRCSGSAVFGLGELNVTTLIGYDEIYIAKYDPSGNLLWAKQAGGPSTDYGRGIASDGSGNWLLSGMFDDYYHLLDPGLYDPVIFGVGEPSPTVVNGQGWRDIFIAKYGSDGILSWVKPAGGIDADEGMGIDVDGSGNSIITGWFGDIATFGVGEATPTDLTSAGGYDIFVAKYNPSGALLWVKQAGGTSWDYGIDVATNDSGDALAIGYFQGAATFSVGDPTPTILTSAGGRDIFTTKYNSSGTSQWAKRAGGISDDFGRSIVAGSSIITGEFTGTSTFDPSGPGEKTLVSTGNNDVFIGHLFSDGSLPVELSYFKVGNSLIGVMCEWTTESELENLGFILERKTDGPNWKEIASYKSDNNLMGQGTTSSPTNYKFVDKLVEPNTTYEYRLADVDYDGVVTYHSTRTVKVEKAPLCSEIEKFTVLPAYPNPFNPSTTITYGLDTDSEITIQIYDIAGKLINILLNTEQQQGWYSVIWNGTNATNEPVPAGIYLSKITSNNTTKTTKLMLLK